MNKKQNYTGAKIMMAMMSKIKEISNASLEVRACIGLSKEDLFWYQVDFGMKFLKLHFGLDALEIATHTNFWDLFVFEWYKDDAWILRNIDLYDVDHYLSWKLTMMDERRLCEVMNEFLEKKGTSPPNPLSF